MILGYLNLPRCAVKNHHKMDPCLQVNGIRAHKFGTTVVWKLHQGAARDRGVIDLGCPFWVPFWVSPRSRPLASGQKGTKPIMKYFQTIRCFFRQINSTHVKLQFCPQCLTPEQNIFTFHFQIFSIFAQHPEPKWVPTERPKPRW